MKIPTELSRYLLDDGRELLGGYIRFLDAPSRNVFSEIAAKSPDWHNGSEPFAITAFGDLLAWDGRYVLLYRFVDGKVDVILSGFSFFFVNLQDSAYQADHFDLPLFRAAKKKLGKLAADECYTFEPLPVLGGTKDVEHMGKGKSREYLSLILR